MDGLMGHNQWISELKDEEITQNAAETGGGNREELTWKEKGKGEARKVSLERLGTMNQEADLET